MYDWANSAFFTTTVGVLIGPYLISLAEKAVGDEGVVLDLFLFKVTPKGLPAFCITISVLSMIVLLPVLGAIADYTNLKKKLMAFFCYLGVVMSALLFFVSDASSYVWAGVFLIVSNMSFAAANVFYNAFLIDITTEDMRDRVSSYGYATGYLGGVVMLLANILLISNAESLGISTGMAVRISFLLASLWWGLFALITFALVRSRGAAKAIPENTHLVTAGFKEIWATLKELVRLRYTMRFLIAYLFYNDGIQTVILQSSVFISYELFTSKGLPEDNSFLLLIFLVAQISALVGAIVFERSGARYRRKKDHNVISRCLVRDRDLCLRVFPKQVAGMAYGRLYRTGPRRGAGPVPLAVFANDPQRARSFVFRPLRNIRERHVLDGNAAFYDYRRGDGVVPARYPRPDGLFYRRERDTSFYRYDQGHSRGGQSYAGRSGGWSVGSC